MYDSQSLVIEKDLSPLQRSARALLLNNLQKLQHGRLTIIERFESQSV